MHSETKSKVLLLDDEKFLLDIYSVKFLKSGYDVFACHSVEEAIASIRRGYTPQAILFDITMPDESGYVFLQRLAAECPHIHCVKIALTNEGQEGEVRRMRELGADLHLLKANYTPSEIVQVVEGELKKRS